MTHEDQALTPDRNHRPVLSEGQGEGQIVYVAQVAQDAGGFLHFKTPPLAIGRLQPGEPLQTFAAAHAASIIKQGGNADRIEEHTYFLMDLRASVQVRREWSARMALPTLQAPAAKAAAGEEEA